MNELAEHVYAGFNLIVVTAEAGWVVEATDSTSATRLTPGIHSVSNGPFRSRMIPALISPKRLSAGWSKRSEIGAITSKRHSKSRPSRRRRKARDVSAQRELGNCRFDDCGSCQRTSTLPISLRGRPPCRTAYVDYSNAYREMLQPGG